MHETNPDYVTDPDPGGTASLFLVVLGIAVCAVGALVLALLHLAGPETATDPHPTPSPSSRPWSEDCTAEELNTGVCYLTWDDIRNQPTYTQAP